MLPEASPEEANRPSQLPSRKFQKVCEILAKHDHCASRLIPILQAVQEEYRYLPEEVMTYLATSLHIPPAEVYGVATFYAHFALAPKGKFVLRLCDGTACHVKRSIPILEALRSKLRVSEAKPTTADLLFTVETVSCLGACGLAPVLLVNDQVHGQITPQAACAIVDAIAAKETAQ
jgi:NADH-quinone oxidoreductase subunit E